MPDVNDDFVAIARAEGWYSEELMRKIAETGHIDFPEVPAKWQRVFVTANGIAVFMVFGAGLVAGLLGQIGEARFRRCVAFVGEIVRGAGEVVMLERDGLLAFLDDRVAGLGVDHVFCRGAAENALAQ